MVEMESSSGYSSLSSCFISVILTSALVEVGVEAAGTGTGTVAPPGAGAEDAMVEDVDVTGLIT